MSTDTRFQIVHPLTNLPEGCWKVEGSDLVEHQVLTFKLARRSIGGPIEIYQIRLEDTDGVRPDKIIAFLFHEEGRLRGLAHNSWASVLAGMTLVGPVFVLVGEAAIEAVLNGKGYKK